MIMSTKQLNMEFGQLPLKIDKDCNQCGNETRSMELKLTCFLVWLNLECLRELLNLRQA